MRLGSLRSVSSVALVALVGLAGPTLTGCGQTLALFESDPKEDKGPAADGLLSPGEAGYVDPGPYLGPVAERRAGQVVFSSAPIARTASDDSAAYTTYDLGDPLFIRYFGADAPQNLRPGCPQIRFIIRAEVNGEYGDKKPSQWEPIGLYDIGDIKVRGAGSLTNVLELPVTTHLAWTSERQDAGEAVIRKFNGTVVPKLREGLNSVRLALTLDCGGAGQNDPVAAEGTLAVKVAPGAVDAYLKKYGPTLGDSPHKENKTLAREIVEVMKQLPKWDNEEFLGAWVASPDWLPIRNELSGLVVARQINAAIIVRSKAATSAKVCSIFLGAFQRDAGGGPLRYGGGLQSPTQFPCINTPK